MIMPAVISSPESSLLSTQTPKETVSSGRGMPVPARLTGIFLGLSSLPTSRRPPAKKSFLNQELSSTVRESTASYCTLSPSRPSTVVTESRSTGLTAETPGIFSSIIGASGGNPEPLTTISPPTR